MINSSPVNIIPPVLRTRRRQQRGQTAVVALLVLLLLSFVGALFITIVGRNLITQGRTHRTLNADYYAEAGLRYADDQLTSSLDGADWRPPLQFQLADGTTVTNSLGVYPAGQDPLSVLIGPSTSVAYTRYEAYKTSPGLQLANINDPDKAYLEQGFARYTTANGRFLLRVTYDPARQSNANTPTARYLKIESIGREGMVDPNDPTTYGSQPVTRLAATLIAYKPIGITDFARFETNIDNRSGVMNLGVPSVFAAVNASNAPNGIVTPGVFDFTGNSLTNPTSFSLPQYPVITTYGAADAYMKDASGNILPNPKMGTGMAPSGYTVVAGGGSLFANASLRLYGVNDFYLNTGAEADGISVAGNILLNDYDPKASLDNTTLDAGNGQNAAIILNPPAMGTIPPTDYVPPTNGLDPTTGNPDFGTPTGQVRDSGSGSSASDIYGNPREVARLDPPVIDAANSATSLTRYQAITENSPPRIDPATMMSTAPLNNPSGTGTPYTAPNAGLFGYGQAVYINNPSDIQRDSTSLVGGHTLVDEWLNSNPGGSAPTTTKGGWVGPFYNPPGAEIVFGKQTQTYGTSTTAQTLSKYGFRITRSDVDSSGNPVLWADLHTDPTGHTPLGRTMTVTYDELDASNVLTTDPSTLSGGPLAAYQANPNNDVMIYAEGNVRVRGNLSAAVPSAGEDDDSHPRHITIITNGTAYIDGSIIKGNPQSSITILARDYVCVNTTQFLAGASDTYPGVNGGLLDFAQDSDQLVQEFNFGVVPSTYGTPLALYISGGAGASGSAAADFDITQPSTQASTVGQPESIGAGAGIPFATSLFTLTFDSTAVNGPSLVTHTTFDLSTLPTYSTLSGATPDQPFQLWIRRDPGTDAGANPTATAATADQPFQLERAAILPMDVRIEAVLYAQNKSFFVIPGPWFNNDTGDNTQAYYQAMQDYLNPPGGGTAVAPTRPGILQSALNQSRFPFYGQPLDLKITIRGAVSEARPADIGAQAAWMQKWGWIPQYHGSTFNNASGTAPATTPPSETAGHPPAATTSIPATGLTFVYDPQDGYPYYVDQTTSPPSQGYLRTDLYGRPLPVTPKLPVSTGLLYSGQNPGPSLLQ